MGRLSNSYMYSYETNLLAYGWTSVWFDRNPLRREDAHQVNLVFEVEDNSLNLLLSHKMLFCFFFLI